MTNFDAFLSRAGETMQESAIRKMGSMLAESRDLVSFAPGYPAEAAFAWDDFRAIADDVLSTRRESVLQYGATRGYRPLLESITGLMAERGISAPLEQLVVTNGSQQGLDLVARVLLDRGDVVLVELPTYTGAISAFRGVGAELVGVRQEADGCDLDALDATLVRLRAANRAHLLRVRDTGFMPEGMMTTLAAGGSPRAVARDDARYPLVRLLDLIDALQLSKAPAADLVAAARRDSLAVVRYWSVAATIGSPRAVDATALFKDPDPSVRVAAATAGLRGGTNPAAVAVLAGALASDQPFGARLAALNTLAFLPALPDAARPMVTQLAQTKDNTDYLGRAANALLAP